jgi:hypothetical protein
MVLKILSFEEEKDSAPAGSGVIAGRRDAEFAERRGAERKRAARLGAAPFRDEDFF